MFPRVTTKSNTCTVHYRVQNLRQRSAPGEANVAQHFATWNDERDAVLGEPRGQTTIERFIHPDDRRFNPNDAETVSRQNARIVETDSLEDVYRFRIVNSKRFAH